MKKIWRVSILLFLLTMFLTAVPAYASSGEESSGQFSLVNPAYADVEVDAPEEPASLREAASVPAATANPPYYSSVAKAGAYVKKVLLKRSKNLSFSVYSTNGDCEEVMMNVLEKAWAATDTTAPDEGDYLRWHVYRLSGGFSVRTSGKGYVYTLQPEVTYFSTNAQEQALDKKLKTVMNQTEIRKASSEYETILAIYQYVTEHVAYDNTNPNSYLPKFSAYAALCKGKAVCQGYASLIYRMMREAGLSVRFIGGKSKGVNHAWNIVRVGKKYYNLDSTWDAGCPAAYYQFFLRGGTTSQFPDHTRDAEFRTSTFNKKYPMSNSACKSSTTAAGQYKITYKLNGGTNNSKNPANHFRKKVTLKSPGKAGYQFAGWYQDSGFKNKITTIPKTSAKNYTLYAKWKKISVGRAKLTGFQSNGKGLYVYFGAVSGASGYRIEYSHSSQFASGKVQYAYAGAKATSLSIKASDCAKRYYVRVRAYKKDSAGKKVYGGKSDAVSGQKITYVLGKKGINNVKNPYYVYKKKPSLQNPERDGYQFLGWYADSGYRSKVTKVSGKCTLYARWKKASS